jgi:hypothetical protein
LPIDNHAAQVVDNFAMERFAPDRSDICHSEDLLSGYISPALTLAAKRGNIGAAMSRRGLIRKHPCKHLPRLGLFLGRLAKLADNRQATRYHLASRLNVY